MHRGKERNLRAGFWFLSPLIALAQRSEGIFALGQGTLYPLLYSLEKKGLIEIAREEQAPGSGRKRRYYRVTAAGRAELDSGLTTLRDIARGMRLVLGARYD
jgi:PadR family transcriptional regulator PadR